MSNVVTDNIGMSDSIKKTFERIDEQPIPEDVSSGEYDLSNVGIISQEYFEKMCDEIEQMNFLELTKLHKQLTVNQDDLIHAKRTADQLIELQDELSKNDDNDLAKAIVEANAETEAGATEGVQAFLKAYDSTMDKLDKLIEKVDNTLKNFEEMPKTTSFLTENMISVLDKNLERLNVSDKSSLKTIKIFYKVLYEIFTNRTSTTFLVDKVKNQKSNVQRLKRDIANDKTGSSMKRAQEKTCGLFLSVFNAAQLTAIEEYLQKLFEDDDIAFYLQYALACFYEHEKVYGKYGKHKWVEVMFMNISDICADMYDLEGGKEYYDQQLLKLKDAIIEILN